MWDQTGSPESPDRRETSEIPRPPFGVRRRRRRRRKKKKKKKKGRREEEEQEQEEEEEQEEQERRRTRRRKKTRSRRSENVCVACVRVCVYISSSSQRACVRVVC